LGTVEFTYVQWLLYLLAAMLAVIVICAAWLLRRARFIRFYGQGGGRLHGQLRASCFVLLLVLTGGVLGLLILGPYIKRELPIEVYEPLEAVVVLDISRSMLAQSTAEPCSIPRLELAVKEAEAFISALEKQGRDRAALVVYARHAYPAIPVPTDDYSLLRRRLALETLHGNVMSMPEGSNHWYAIRAAASALDSSARPAKRLLAIITDGEHDAPGDALQRNREKALKALVRENTDAYIIGVGEPGIPVPVPRARTSRGCPDKDKGYLVQAAGGGKGSIMTTATDTASLRALASALEGEYLRSEDGSSLARRALRELNEERRLLGTEFRTAYDDLSEHLIAASLLMLALLALARTP
jgi:hypothetical protein